MVNCLHSTWMPVTNEKFILALSSWFQIIPNRKNSQYAWEQDFWGIQMAKCILGFMNLSIAIGLDRWWNFHHKGIRRWSRLPREIVQSVSLDVFKSQFNKAQNYLVWLNRSLLFEQKVGHSNLLRSKPIWIIPWSFDSKRSYMHYRLYSKSQMKNSWLLWEPS